MKANTQRSLGNAVSLLLTTPEFDRIRLFLISDASADKSEAEEIIKFVGDAIREHLLEHGRQVRAIAAKKRAV